METIEISTNQMEDTEWNLWQFLLSKEDRWVKSVTNSSNLLFVEVCLHTCLVEDLVSLKKLSISWIWNINLGFNASSTIACDSTLEVLVQTFCKMWMTKDCLFHTIHLNVDSIKTHL